jgi:hypothetical protein
MVKLGLFVRLEAKPGKENDVAKFLEAGLGMANQETTTPAWFALRLSPSFLESSMLLTTKAGETLI